VDLSVYEIFSSFQGEGIHTGLPTTFIRLSGCNLDCRWCDTRYAIDPSTGRSMGVDDIVHEVKEQGNEMICLTGGEPLVQKRTLDLVNALLEIGCSVDIETNGTVDLSLYSALGERVFLSVDVKTPSSGEQGSFLQKNFEYLRRQDQLKFIIGSQEDLRFSVDLVRTAAPECELIFTPVSNRGGDMVAEELKRSIKMGELPQRRTRLMVQTHKVIWPEDMAGV
jgi:7-carboxy-7-deazaguanine synthase